MDKIPGILKEITPLAWSVVVLTLGLIYAKPMIGLLDRLIRAKVTKEGIEVEAQKQLGKLADQSEKLVDQSGEVTEILRNIGEQIEKIAKQEKPFADFSDAFRDAEECIVARLNNGIKRQKIKQDKIEIKILAVAMTFSWKFICNKIPKILTNYPFSYIDVEVVFVDYQYLESLDLETWDLNFAEESKQRVREINNFINGLPDQLCSRLSISARVYRNLPNWHGILVDNEHLYLGRTDWSFLTDRPKLTVGQNKYRYFDHSTSSGIERIKLFKNWHKYYFQFGSEPLPITSVPSK